MSCARFFVVGAYPGLTSRYFDEYASAVVSCWISSGRCSVDREAHAEHMVRADLAEEGWQVASVLMSEVVDASDYRARREGREQFWAALRDGYYYGVARQPRETVGIPASARTLRANVVRALENGERLFSLKTRRQYANGVLETGNQLVPLWTNEDEARAWRPDFPGHRVVSLDARGVRRLLLGALQEDELFYVGLGTGTGLVTLHPADLLAVLDGRTPPGEGQE